MFKRMLFAALLLLGTVGAAPAQQPPLPVPVLKYDSQSQQGPLIRVDLTVTNWFLYSPVLFFPAPNLPPCGANPNASRTWVHVVNAVTNQRVNSFCAFHTNFDLTQIWFARPSFAKPKRVFVTITDRLTKRTVKSNVVAIP